MGCKNIKVKSTEHEKISSINLKCEVESTPHPDDGYRQTSFHLLSLFHLKGRTKTPFLIRISTQTIRATESNSCSGSMVEKQQQEVNLTS